jgi:hypothetical protein
LDARGPGKFTSYSGDATASVSHRPRVPLGLSRRAGSLGKPAGGPEE